MNKTQPMNSTAIGIRFVARIMMAASPLFVLERFQALKFLAAILLASTPVTISLGKSPKKIHCRKLTILGVDMSGICLRVNAASFSPRKKPWRTYTLGPLLLCRFAIRFPGFVRRLGR